MVILMRLFQLMMEITALQKLFLQKKHQKPGDMNDDGIIDLKDALWILKTLVGME